MKVPGPAILVLLWLPLTLYSGLAAQTLGPERPAALSKLSQVRALSSEGVSVKVRATVTYCDRDRGLLFVQDGDEASAVRIPQSREPGEWDPQPGQVVELEGVTAKGRIHPTIRSKSFHVVGQTNIPNAMELRAESLLQPSAESRWVRVTGWIPAINRAGTRVNCSLIVAPGQALDVVINGGDTAETKEFAAALAEVTGVFSLRFDAAGQISGGRLYVNDPSAIHKRRSLPVTPIMNAAAAPAKAGAVEPFRVRGSVVNHSLGDFVIVRDSSGSIRVPYRSLSYFSSGSLVEVFAYPLQYKPELLLTNVTVKLVLADTSTEEPAAAIITPTAPNTNLTTLTRVMQIRKLSPQEASRGYPAHITGLVTFCDLGSYLHFLQDDTAGIYFDLSRVQNRAGLRWGQKVEIEGFTGPGDYAPVLICQTVKVIGPEALPAPEVVTFRKLMSGNFDSQWVLLKGVIRNQWGATNSSSLALFTGEGVIKVVAPGTAQGRSTQSLVDATVEAQGVCRTIFDDHRRLQSVEIQVPDWKYIDIKEPATDDPFKLPVRTVADLFQFHAEASGLHRARLVGVVTLRLADGSFYLQDGSGGLQIQAAQISSSIEIGSTVDVVGFPVIVDQMAMLQDAVVHTLKDGTPVEPVDLKPDGTLEDTLQATLVRLQGEVLGRFPHGSEELVTVRFGQKLIDVLLQKPTQQDRFGDLAPGSIVRLTGVYVAQFDGAGNVQSFRVLLRSPDDVTVLSRPAWWNAERTLWASGGLTAILLLALVWVRALRRQVHQRTQQLHEEIEHHKRTEAKLEAEIAERKRMQSEVERTHQELLIASRQAGMAEVATSVLHNVGNVLNSVNVSTSLVADRIKKSKATNLARAAEMIDAHAADLANFFTTDPKGRQLPQYFRGLAQHLDREQAAILVELESLRKNVEHIKGIVVMQQNYAKVFGSAESVKPAELVEDALRMHSGALVRHEVRVIREYEQNLPDITVDKHKVLQILVNLISNAKKACDDSPKPEKLLTVHIAHGEGRVRISVIDNGVGIPAENLTRIFNHGFTTRKDGHGFGLHSGALAAKEMGGALIAQSEGWSKGAKFTIELPVATPKADSDTAEKSLKAEAIPAQ